ncbi:hypothetical protein [Oceanicella actignis]|uniref:Uncharacterized protein n=1 Tax=Oceanicella actignis TaxID=1189325 RepID=A0A1M7TH25_9RHOB|nr:hypothetical protein [Oceanicella actignis]TYO88481.1 hypothetical protein LY05_02141 [Oceanicella actignis]SET59621.1 hypothetical protein SAMN04488119_10663 [Oceanicella actignis]SHN69953.1 hypothetical protein SAMN05216200_106140 [Oceanicella actignis]
MSRHSMTEAPAPVAGDAFSFGAAEAQLQGVQNMMTLLAAPWRLFLALSAEMARESLGPGR